MSLTIRKIEKDDYNEVEVLTREAFWNIYRPGCSEHLVLHILHKNNSAILIFINIAHKIYLLSIFSGYKS